jgi:hypothetical protein
MCGFQKEVDILSLLETPIPEIVSSTSEVENPITNLEPDNSETTKEPGPSDDIE